MKKHRVAIIVGISALAVGFGIGYFVGKKKGETSIDVNINK